VLNFCDALKILAAFTAVIRVQLIVLIVMQAFENSDLHLLDVSICREFGQ